MAQYTLTIPSYQTSRALELDYGAETVITTDGGATATVEYTTHPYPDVQNSAVTWVAWPNGPVPPATTSRDVSLQARWLRITSSGGATTIRVNELIASGALFSQGWKSETLDTTDATADPDTLPLYQLSRTVTLKTNTVAAISASVTDFPAYVSAVDIRADLLSHGNDVAFFDGSGTLLPHETLWQDQIGFKGAAWIWAFDAFSAGGKIFYGYVANTNAGDAAEPGIWVSSVKISDGTVATFRLLNPTTTDDHNVPGLYMRNDGRIVAVYTSHAADTTVRTRVSTNAYDVSAWGAEATFTTGAAASYGMIRKIGTTVYQFYRALQTDATWYYRISSDDGLTFGSTEYPWIIEAGIARTNGLYWDAQINTLDPLRLDVVCTNGNPGAAGGSGGDNVCLFHAYCKPNGTAFSWYKTDGTPITLTAANTCPTTGMTNLGVGNDTLGEFFIPKVFVKPDGNPRAISQRSTDGDLPGPKQHKYVMFDYANGQWTEKTICAAGVNLTVGQTTEQWHYLGWFDFDRNDLSGNTVYLSRGKEFNLPIYNVEQWVLIGDTWTFAQALTDVAAPTGNDFAVAVRPVSVRNARATDPWQVLYMAGYYQNFSSSAFSCGAYGWPPAPSGFHVKVPWMNSAADTVLTMKYKASAAVNRDQPNVVWSDYAYVSHMAMHAGTFYLKDSTKVAYTDQKKVIINLITQLNGRYKRVPGPFVSAPAMNYANITTLSLAPQFVNVSDINFAGLAGLTVESIVRPTADSTTHNVFACWNTSVNTTAAVLVRVGVVAGTCTPRGFITRQTDTEASDISATTFALNTWAHVGVTFDSTKVYAISNGQKGSGTATTGAMDATNSLLSYIGNGLYNNAFPLIGDIAEIRIAYAAQSADRILLTYQCLLNITNFTTISAATAL